MHFLVSFVFMAVFVIAFSEDCRPGTCRPKQTCCPTNIPTIFGCCDYEDAVCCADRTHCCPKDNYCDLEKAACFHRMKELDTIESLNRLDKRRGTSDEERLAKRKEMCDLSTYCPHGSTCCLNAEDSFDCCPFPRSTCCPDKVHCCPQGTMCDASSQYCIEDGLFTTSELMDESMNIDQY